MSEPSAAPATLPPADLAGAEALAAVGRGLATRGWALGTSGNFSAVRATDPLRLLVTSSGVDKTKLTAGDILEVDAEGRVVAGSGRPSAEMLLHLAVVDRRGAGAVLHTHSVWGTLLSEAHRAEGGLEISGWEMLKGLSGVATHEHREWIPILPNSQDMPSLAARTAATLREHPASHAFLLAGHGLYTWGKDLVEAARHVEIVEFLLEVTGRRGNGRSGAWQS